MISFHLRSVPADALGKYFAYREQLCFEKYGYYNEDDDPEEDENGNELPTQPRPPVEAFEMWQLNATRTNSTNFEHDAEEDADFLSSHGFSYLFNESSLDDCCNPFTIEDTKNFLEKFKTFVEDSAKFQKILDDYYDDDEDEKAWMTSLICQRLIPFFELAVRDNEGFVTEWG